MRTKSAKQSKTKPATSTNNCQPLETKAPNAEEQKPTFPEQTRACGVETKTAYEVAVVAKGLNKPWAVEPLPDGDFLITEKDGKMRIVSKDGKIGEPLAGLQPIGQGGTTEASKLGGLPPIAARQQGGLLDVALSPNFSRTRPSSKVFPKNEQTAAEQASHAENSAKTARRSKTRRSFSAFCQAITTVCISVRGSLSVPTENFSSPTATVLTARIVNWCKNSTIILAKLCG